MLELKNIQKSYKMGEIKQQVLNGISINFREKEFVSILGASGSGKTTLLNIIGGLDQYDDGDLIIDNVSTKKYSSGNWDSYRNHRIGFIFQNYNLIGHQSILSNVELSLTLAGVSKIERIKRSIEALEKVGLKDHMNKKPNQLSGGQMQRVAIARALVNNPDIILADEPTGALDSKTSIQIMDLLKEISKDKLVIMVTHNPEIVKTYSTRIIELKDGLILNDSNPFESVQNESQTKKTKKTSMSIFTSLGLSLNNLLTKKGRTFLTAVAGSIGIVGIALVLSLSNGVQKYAKSLEVTSADEYPINLQKTYSNLFDISIDTTQVQLVAKGDNIISYDDITSKLKTTGISTIKYNNLTEFKKYLDSNKEINQYANSVEYGFNVPLQVFSNKTYSKVEYIDFSSINSLYTEVNTQPLFTELSDSQEVFNKNYELVYGKRPSKYNEAMLVISQYGSVPDSILYALGFKDPEKLNTSIDKIMKGEKLSKENTPISYDDILNTTYKVILNTDYYKLENGVLVNYSKNVDYMKKRIDNGIDLKIVGIAKVNGIIATGNYIGYTKELTTTLINKIAETDIAKAQLANKNINIFTGKPFDGLNSSYEINLSTLGISNIDNPDTINIYPKNAESKEKILNIINKYNEDKKANNREDLEISYSDSMAELVSSINQVISIISAVLIGIVAISLVVSSIMIAIITYISVLERTKEIGILRAIGATKRDISRVFKAETIIEGLISGTLGILATLVINFIVNSIVADIAEISNLASLSFTNICILIALSIVLNLIAGFIPAQMASNKNPVEALRSE